MIRRQLVIIGAGPAGMSAAIAAAEAGLTPTVIDENPQVGGQIFRRPPKTLQPKPGKTSDPNKEIAALLQRRFHELSDKIELMTDTTAWGLFPPRRIAVIHEGASEAIEAEQLVLAQGAYEYVPPFPGWTMPGVLTPGFAQTLVKTLGVRPGRRVLIAGSGPFLLVVALQLHGAGVDVVGVVEAARALDVLAALPALVSDPAHLKQGWRYIRALKRAGIPMHRGHVIVEARGAEEVREAVFAPCDRQWKPDRSRSVTVAVDTLCVGYGFIPRTDLAQLAGCRMRFDNPQGGWIPEVDEEFQTSASGVWSAGDGGGVAGVLVAQVEGSMVGLNIARRLGALDESTYQRRRAGLAATLEKLRRFRAGIDRVCAVRPGLTALPTPKTLVCRCEELSLAEVTSGIQCGGADIRTLKVMTRVGMGSCQGRSCWPSICRLVASRTGRTIEEIGPLSVRAPVRPITLGCLAGQTATPCEKVEETRAI